MFIYQWKTDKFIRIFSLIGIMCITIIGNTYIIFKLCFGQQIRRTRLHLFIVNLAIGDLTICFCTMTTELFLLIHDQEWLLGNLACKLTVYVQVVTIASTTFINLAMTYDRYEAICCPFRINKSLGHIHRVIICCWLSSFIVAIPQLFIFKQTARNVSSTQYHCASTGYTAEWQRRVYFTTFTSYVLIIPVVCMTLWYAKIIIAINKSKENWKCNSVDQVTTGVSSYTAKVKTVKLAMTIIIVFVACWTPYMVLTLIQIYSNNRFRIPSWLDGVLQTICFLQSGLNPFIYIIFNRKDRKDQLLAIPATKLAALPSSQRSYQKSQRKQRERGGSIVLISIEETTRFKTNSFSD